MNDGQLEGDRELGAPLLQLRLERGAISSSAVVGNHAPDGPRRELDQNDAEAPATICPRRASRVPGQTPTSGKPGHRQQLEAGAQWKDNLDPGN